MASERKWVPVARDLLLFAVVAALGLFVPFDWFEGWLGNWVIILLAWVTPLVFIVYYTALRPWWHSPMGRMLVWLDIAWFLVVFPSGLADNFGVHLAPTTVLRVQIISLVVTIAVITSRIYLMGEVNGWKPHFPWAHSHQGDHDAG